MNIIGNEHLHLVVNDAQRSIWILRQLRQYDNIQPIEKYACDMSNVEEV